jgi:hypothetical protein
MKSSIQVTAFQCYMLRNAIVYLLSSIASNGNVMELLMKHQHSNTTYRFYPDYSPRHSC